MDPLFIELESRLLLSLSTDHKVNQLVDLVCSVQSPVLSETLSGLVLKTAKLIHPKKGLFLLKFISQYPKKDSRFLKLVEKNLPEVVLFCYQTSSERETVKLYIAGWKMQISPWPQIATKCEATIRLFDKRHELGQVVELLQRSYGPLGEPSSVEARLDCVIEAINYLV